mgnify:CR=1 FL=1
MTARTVLKWPDAKLLKPSEDVRSFDSSLEDLAEDLYHTMVTSFGAGIAAPQIGVHKNVCVISSSYVPSLKTESFRGIEECVVLVNPVLEACDQKKFVWEEGCLSARLLQKHEQFPNENNPWIFEANLSCLFF